MLRRNILLMSGLVAVSASTILTACGGNSDMDKDLFELVRSNTDLSLLGDSIVAANLEATFQANTSYTLFAPNNAAFVAALAELGMSKEQLFADKALLSAVLSYHLLPGKINFGDIPLNTFLKTVQGATLKVDNVSGSLIITDGRNRTSRIIQPNLEASNGVVHIVDKVILPPV